MQVGISSGILVIGLVLGSRPINIFARFFYVFVPLRPLFLSLLSYHSSALTNPSRLWKLCAAKKVLHELVVKCHYCIVIVIRNIEIERWRCTKNICPPFAEPLSMLLPSPSPPIRERPEPPQVCPLLMPK
jgi:hypothetical protein